jgi:hypothetical protein
MMTAVLLPVIAVWAYAAVELHVLALRRGRRGVRSGARRAGIALIIGTPLAVAAVIVAVAVTGVAGWWPAPPLLVPAAAALCLTRPRLGRLAGRLATDPWGPSEPSVRQAAGHPAVVVPAQAALLGALAAGFATDVAAAIVTYGFVAAATAGLALDARRRLARSERLRTGTLPRVLVRQPARPPAGARQLDRDRGRSEPPGRRPAAA